MAVPMVTPPTGASLQRLAEQSWDRLGAGSVLHYEGSQWTGEELAERVRRVARGLQEAGLGPGERVVTCMANCPEVSITYSAIWRTGAVATPVLFLLSEDELRHVLSDSGAALVVTTPEFLPKVTAAAADLASVRGIVVVGGPMPERRPAAPEGPPLLPFAELDTGPARLARRLRPVRAGGPALHRRHDRPLQRGDDQPQRAVGGGMGGHGHGLTTRTSPRPCSRFRCPTFTG